MSRIAGILQNSDDERRMSILAKMAEDWETDVGLRNEIVAAMNRAEQGSEQVIHWVNQLTDERMDALESEIRDV